MKQFTIILLVSLVGLWAFSADQFRCAKTLSTRSDQGFYQLEKPIVFSHDGVEFVAKWQISKPTDLAGSSAYVFLTDDKKFVIKFYDRYWDKKRTSARSQSFYEFWAVKYLRSKGLNFVLSAVDYFKTGEGYVLVKPYLNKVEIQSELPSWMYEYPEQIEKRDLVKQAFDPEVLIEFIKDNSSVENPERILNGHSYINHQNIKVYKWRTGDFIAMRNWLHTAGGWILIDL